MFRSRLESLNQVPDISYGTSTKLQRQSFHVVKFFFFHPTTSRGAVPTLRETLKSTEILRDIPKSSEFHLDFTLFYRQFSQGFLRQVFGPHKHNTVQNLYGILKEPANKHKTVQKGQHDVYSDSFK